MSAIKRRQKAMGMDQTGILDLSDVVVTESAVRVSDVLAQPGDEASGYLTTVTATTKSVTVPVESLDMGSIKSGQQVTVVLPDRTTVPRRAAALFPAYRRQDQAGTSRLSRPVGPGAPRPAHPQAPRRAVGARHLDRRRHDGGGDRDPASGR
jgi:hypothetical protein